ncbi:MAG: M48 family metalloprotease, partial [Holophagales bacterium]|nr:M48 family metalloprotease [Holophagales bacterium]
AFDEALEQTAHAMAQTHVVLWLIVQLVRLFVWLTRRVLWALMWIAHGLSCFLSRQMEFDADRYEARLAGSAAFESTAKELAMLGAAYSGALHDLGATWQDGRLVDSLPELVHGNRQRLPLAVKQEILRRQSTAETGLFDTHPADRERIASARKEVDRPAFRSSLPATALFRDFRALAKSVSLAFYELNLGHSIEEDRLLGSERVFAEKDESDADRGAHERFCRALADADRPLALPPTLSPTPLDPNAVTARLQQLRAAVLASGERYRKGLEGLEECLRQLHDLKIGSFLVDQGARFAPERVGLKSLDAESFIGRSRLLDRRQAQLGTQMEAHERALVERYHLALVVFDLPGLAERDPSVLGIRQERDRLLAVSAALAAQQGALGELRYRFTASTAVGEALSELRTQGLAEGFESRIEELREVLVGLSGSLSGVAYPFEHREASCALGTWLVNAPPEGLDIQALLELAHGTLGRFYEVYGRVLARLSRLAERGELILGLPPLPEPDPARPA